MMHVLMMTNEAFNTVQANPKKFLDLIKKNPNDSSWFVKQFRANPYEDTGYSMDEFALDFDKDYDKYAISNAVKIYENLKHLPANVIYSTRFWAWFTFEFAYKQTLQISKNPTEKTLVNSWFPKSSQRKILMQGPIAREYIKVKMVRELPNDEQEQYINLLFGCPSLYFRITERTITDNSDILRVILSISSDLTNRGISLTDDICNDLLKTVGQLGSVVLVDSLSYNELYSSIFERFKNKHPEIYL